MSLGLDQKKKFYLEAGNLDNIFEIVYQKKTFYYGSEWLPRFERCGTSGSTAVRF